MKIRHGTNYFCSHSRFSRMVNAGLSSIVIFWACPKHPGHGHISIGKAVPGHHHSIASMVVFESRIHPTHQIIFSRHITEDLGWQNCCNIAARPKLGFYEYQGLSVTMQTADGEGQDSAMFRKVQQRRLNQSKADSKGPKFHTRSPKYCGRTVLGNYA